MRTLATIVILVVAALVLYAGIFVSVWESPLLGGVLILAGLGIALLRARDFVRNG